MALRPSEETMGRIRDMRAGGVTRSYPTRLASTGPPAQRQRAGALAASDRWTEVDLFFADTKEQFEEAYNDDSPEGLQKRAAVVRRLVERVEIYPNGRKRIVGTLRCITGEVPARVANQSTIKDEPHLAAAVARRLFGGERRDIALADDDAAVGRPVERADEV